MNAALLFATTIVFFSCSCSSDSDSRQGDARRSKKPASPAQVAQAQVATAAGPTVFAFGKDEVGQLPFGWKAEGTNQKGPVATWKVTADDTAPSKPNVLSLTSTNHDSGSTFNICWSDHVRFQDGRLEISLKPNSGEEDQGGGPIWRVQDKDNYYICRANPLESNFRVYYVQDGSRKQLATTNVQIPSGRWHTIAIEHRGEHIVCYLNGDKLLEATDNHLPSAGGVGVWTKADAASSFDDVEILP